MLGPSISSSIKLVLASIAFLSQTVCATPITSSGELSPGDRFFNRPRSLTALSTLGTHTAYDVFDFRVSAAGTYSIEMPAFGAYTGRMDAVSGGGQVLPPPASTEGTEPGTLVLLPLAALWLALARRWRPQRASATA